MTQKKRIAITLDPRQLAEVRDMAHNISKERGKNCTISELCSIALAALVVGYHHEHRKEDQN